MIKRYDKALEIATKRIQRMKRREMIYRAIVIGMVLLMLLVCLGFLAAGGDDAGGTAETQNVTNMIKGDDAITASDPNTKLILIDVRNEAHFNAEAK